MTLYTMDNCPWCEILKKRLTHANIDYVENKDAQVIREKGFKTVPRLEFPNGKLMDFEQAISWVNEQNL